ncbi:uncharacterized protein KIAA0825 homolog isoform X2 [Denticeps clupeoides]|uniref:uncharacterized protein KIAA0825 homolog isoform X2 n=1 Tax=Denticeps clupeoides TaxID=299321 RepID=UPI0010A3AB31|nr:uncharacterized protein KIAA0825 homolog isoform X2 [Denticeps clupeoides]
MDWHADLPWDHMLVDLLPPGIPGEDDFQQLLRDTEEKLKQNSCSIEQSLKELQKKMGDTGLLDRPSSPTECLQWLCSRNAASFRVVTTGHQEILNFLLAMHQYLRAGKGREEMVLQLLLNISCQCGVAFPNTAPPDTAPPAMCNSVQDKSSLEVQELWEEVRFQLQHHLLHSLQPDDSDVARRLPQRIFTLQKLCFLYPEAHVLNRYQNLQSKAVQALVHKTQSSSSGMVGERGFERLFLGFQTASPSLCSMLAEDLQVLTGVGAEPHAILTFLNEAYLGTLSQELGALMQREFEVALKDNTVPLGKTGKSGSKSKSAVAPEPQRKDRNFSLTWHQLGCLTQLASTLLDLEHQVQDLASNLGFLNCTREPCCRGGKKPRDDAGLSAAEGGKVDTPDLLPQGPKNVALVFEWRAAFWDLVPHMTHCVKVVLEDVCAKSLKQDDADHARSTLVMPAKVPQSRNVEHSCPENNCPKMITKFCADVIQELDCLLPLAIACRDDVLLPVRSCFVDVCARVVLALATRLEEKAVEVPISAPFQNLTVLLPSSICLHQRLLHYMNHLTDSAHTPLSLLPITRCQKLTSALQEQLSGYCLRICATSLLHDPESHYWADSKPFYEDERCSFSIQMWHYFLCGLCSDLWVALPPALACQLLAQLLYQCLELLLQRYAHAQPSYRRTPQIRLDIVAILQCVLQLLWSVCESPEQLQLLDGEDLSPSSSLEGLVSSIHSLCTQLVSVLVVITAPLEDLCRLVSDSSPAVEGATIQTSVRWLNMINPDLFPVQSLRDGAESEVSILWLLRLLTSGPDWNPALVLRTILARGSVLLQTLITHSQLCADDGTEVSPESQKGANGFLEAVVSLLGPLNKTPRALTLALEPYLEKAHIWDRLYSAADSGKPEPVVLQCIRGAVFQPVDALLTQLVSMVQATENHHRPLLPQQPPDCLLSKIPKDWNYIPQEDMGKDARKNNSKTRTLQALSFIFSNLPITVASVPLPVRYLFAVAEKRISQHGRQMQPTGLLLWVLFSRLCQGLEDEETLERLAPQPLHREARGRLALLSECLQASVGQQKGVPKPTVEKTLQALEERRPKWTSSQLTKARKLCSESVLECGESDWLRECGGSAQLTEQKMRLLLLEVCHEAGGIQHLRQIYHIIRRNEKLLWSKLSGSPNASADSQQMVPSVTFDLGVALNTCSSTNFNAFMEFNHIGYDKFDQGVLSRREWDWPSLLPSCQRAILVTFRALLANRWEMQKDAALEDEEKLLVDELRKVCSSLSKKFQLESSSTPAEPTAAEKTVH